MAVETLFYPFTSDLIPWPDAGARILYINAIDAPALETLQHCAVFAVQWHKPLLAPLYQRTIDVTSEMPDGAFDVVLMNGTRQKEETRGYLARGLRRLNPGGLLMAAAANDAGGRRLGEEFAALGLSPESESKHKARVVRAVRETGALPAATEQAATEQKAGQWIEDSRLQPILDGTYYSRPGLFSWDRIDPGSALLTQTLPAGLTGHGADFGCGYGYLARHCLTACEEIETLVCVDTDYRALSACRETLAAFENKVHYAWHDLTTGQPPNAGALDWIVMNPPFHEDKETAVDLGRGFIETAAGSLRPGGDLWLVANRHLPYEKTLAHHFDSVCILSEEYGYKVIHARRTA